MDQAFGNNAEALFDPGSFDIGGHRTGSTGRYCPYEADHSLYLASAVGKTHGADFRISEPEHAHLTRPSCWP
jgi:hypothetical protein